MRGMRYGGVWEEVRSRGVVLHESKLLLVIGILLQRMRGQSMRVEK